MALTDVTFPLVPRHRLLGLAFGALHSARRGLGSDIAGSRPYRPGDDMTAIDWNASAKLSSARDADEFVVRERFAEEAPRVLVLCDRRPGMALYPEGLPWLRKPRALEVVTDLVAESAFKARGLFGYLDFAHGEQPFWSPPQSQSQWGRREVSTFGDPDFEAPIDNLARGLDLLAHLRLTLPAGTFLFVLSDFLVSPPAESWTTALAFRWDVVPVIVQDPVWEQSFPPVDSIALPIRDPDRGRNATVRLRRGEVRERARQNEVRLAAILDRFSALGLDPVVVGSSDRIAVLQTFLDWADRRRYAAREWRRGA